MTIATIAIISAVVALFIANYFWGWRMPVPYRDRSFQGRVWKRAFPRASTEQIREFLSIFVEGFGFRAKEKLNFAPEDELMQIYRAVNPSNLCGDSLEFETLDMLIEKRYGIKLSDIWTEKMTLGQLFTRAIKQ